MVGTSFPYSGFPPKAGQARGIQIHIDGRMLGIRFPTELNLVGNAKETLKLLLPMLERKENRAWQQEIEENVSEWWRVLESRAQSTAQPINLQKLFWELSPHLPDNCIITSDSGSAANWFARDLQVREGMKASLSGNLATMGLGVPYAIAAKSRFPERTPIALAGDGAMKMA